MTERELQHLSTFLLILRAKKVRCLLCAPTGRAAKRLSDMDDDEIDCAVLFGGGPLPTRNSELLIESYRAYNPGTNPLTGLSTANEIKGPWLLIEGATAADFNGDGRLNDPLTHVGVVERTEPDGTVVFSARDADVLRRQSVRM